MIQSQAPGTPNPLLPNRGPSQPRETGARPLLQRRPAHARGILRPPKATFNPHESAAVLTGPSRPIRRWPGRLDLEGNGGASLETEGLAGLVGGGGLAVEHGGEGDGLLDELGVGLGASLAADAEVVF